MDDIPKGASLERGIEGNFKTMFLKEYLPALCGALASAFSLALVNFPIDEQVVAASDFQHRCTAMDVQSFDHAMGPDFAG